MKKSILIVSLLTTILTTTYLYSHIWLPYLNEYIIGHSYNYPSVDEPFVVANEPKTESVPPFLQNMLRSAFHEYKIIFDNDHPNPQLIVRGECHKSTRRKVLHKDVPYISISGEPKGVRKDQYRKYGLPFAEIVSFTPKNNKQIYAPFIAWSDIELLANRKYDNYADRKFLVYVAGSCVKHRENFFALTKATNLGAEALGKCSNTAQGKTAPGGYGHLNNLYMQYNFVIAMENTQKPGYITEKIVNAFNSGAIPIYWGDSATVKSIFNPKAFIDLNDFASFEEAIEYIKYLQSNPLEMDKMHNEPILNSLAASELFTYNSDSENVYILEHAKKLRTLYDTNMLKLNAKPNVHIL